MKGYGALLERYNAGGFDLALNYLKSLSAVDSELQTAVRQIQLQQPRTVSDLIALFDAYGNLGAAEG